MKSLILKIICGSRVKNNRIQKLVLDIAIIEEDFFEDAAIIGLVAPLPTYKLIWQINQSLPVDFERNHEHEKKHRDTYFPVYTYFDSEKIKEHVMYTNRKLNQYLIGEAKNIDFFWLIKGGYAVHETAQFILSLLSSIQIIHHSFIIPNNQLPNRQHLIL